MRVIALFRAHQVLRLVDGDPEPLVAEGVELSLLRQLGERRLLVVAPLRQPLERFLVEDVDAAVHPVRQTRSLAEAGHAVALQLDDSELRDEPRDHYRRRRTVSTMGLEHRLEVDVVELVAVDREHRAALLPFGRGETKAATPA